MTQPPIERTLRDYLRDVSTMSLATVDQAGKPHAANLYFAPDDRLNLYFVSDAKSAHCRHVASRPDVAGTAYAPVRMWQQIKGVQFHGKCEPIDAGEWALVWKVYLDKFPHITEVESMIRAQRFYRIRVNWFRYIDNTVKFGHKVEIAWPPIATPD